MKNNEKMTIDDQVRAALENFAQPYNAEHWQTMTERLDALNAADASFDKSLRGRLADISALPMADAWSKMSEKLDDMDAADSSFDKALRGRLADVAVVPSRGDWSKMAEKLDDFEDGEEVFDDVLRKKLENIAGRHPNHWAMMNERLDREFTLKGKIVRYKVMEVALMLFAFFTVLNVLDFTNSEVKINKEALNSTTPQASELKIKNEASNATATPENVDLKIKNFESNSMTPQGAESKIITPTTETLQTNSGLLIPTNSVKAFDNSPSWRLRGGILNGQNKKQNEQNTLQNAQPNLMPTGQPIVDNSVQKAFFTEGGDLRNNSVQDGDLPTAESVNANNNAVKSLTANQIAQQAIVDVIAPINTLQANLLTNNGLDAPINVAKTNFDKKGRWRLSTFGTAALDWVTTSFVDKAREQHFQKQGVVNVGINALVGYRRGKVELETGIMINRKKYSIENVEVIKLAAFRGITTVEKPKDLRLSIVSIPLNLNVKLKETRRLNIYAHTGVATNAIVDALDRREDTKDPSANPNAGAPQPQKDEILAIYSKGLINGGETKDNVFFTGHIGVGVEYKMTPTTSLFLQPTASYMLSKTRGIGNLNDRIRTYSIQGGAKWRL
jgi:hypothetical protein